MNFAISQISLWTPTLSILRFFTEEGAAVPGGRPCRDQTPAPGGSYSVVVGRCLVLTSGLLIMTTLAESSPVAPVPEELRITSVCFDVIHHRCLHVLALPQALLTQWVCLQELSTGLLPCATVTTAGSGPNLLWVQCPVRFTVFCPGRYELRAAGMLARDLRFRRHQRTRPHSANFSKPPRPLMYCLAVSTISL